MVYLLFLLLSFDQGGSQAARAEVWKIQSQITSLDLDLERLQKKLRGMKQDSRRISDEIVRVELERSVVLKNIEKHELELKESGQKLIINREHQAGLMEQAREQQVRIRSRLRELYKRGALGYSGILLKQSRLSELINAYHYAKILTKRDQEILTSYKMTLVELQSVETRLNEIRDKAEKTRQNLADRQSDLDTLLKKREQSLNTIKSETRKKRQLLKDLELEREELQVLIRRLTEENANPAEIQVPITRYRGKLSWPGKGKLLRKFGIYRDPEFRTKRKQNGIDLAVPKGRRITSVYGGKVIFADWFKSYGNLIIIDHNSKVVTFYAHCDKMFVKKGDFVERDMPIGLTGDSGSLEGPLLHFEIRNKTKPEDPLKWLKKRPKKRRKKRR